MTGPFRPPGMRLAGAVSIVLVLAAMGGCGRGDGQGGAPAEVELPEGREFLSTEVLAGGKPKELADGSRVRLAFHDGDLRAEAGCNHLMGNARLDDGRLVVDGMGGTEMGCPEELMKQDEWLTAFLTSRPRWNLDGDELTLTGKDTEIRLTDRRVADPDKPLRGTDWILDTIIDGETASSLPASLRKKPLLKLGDGTAAGFDGCNSFSARAAVSGATLKLSQVVSTLRACHGERQDVASKMLEVLTASGLKYEIEAGRLTLTAPNGKGLGFSALQ